LFKMDCKFIFPLLFEELLYATTWLKLPQRLKAKVPNKYD
jgi:hypothetical protein